MSGLFMFQRTRNPHAGPTGAHGLTGMATLLLTLSVLLQLAGEPAQQWLRYERDAVLTGQVWRLITAHLLHLSWAHLMLNAVGLMLLAALLGKQQRASDWWLATLVSAVAIGVGLLIFNPALGWYVGLSGLVHGLFAAGCLALMRRAPLVGLLALLALAAKLAWEQVYPAAPSREVFLGGAIVVDAHLYGAVGGLLASASIHLCPMWRRLRRMANSRRHMA